MYLQYVCNRKQAVILKYKDLIGTYVDVGQEDAQDSS